MKKRAYFFHLLNDFSGSPNILSQVIDVLKEEGYKICVYTSRDKGFLSDKKDVKYCTYTYKWSPAKLITLWRLFYVQIKLFFKVLFLKGVKDQVIYINTLLPFGPALAGKLRGAKVIYHIHESYIQPAVFRRFLVGVARVSAEKVIMVSNYLFEEYPSLQYKTEVIYNALPAHFVSKIDYEAKDDYRVLMLASLKGYKGVVHYLKIAALLPEVTFELVLNTTEKEIETYFQNNHKPPNLQVYPSQSDVHPFYKRASLVLNLTIPEQCKESFGMTVLEAKAYGIPSIVPPAGGPMELVTDGVDGYHLHSKEVNKIASCIRLLSCDTQANKKMSNYAHKSFYEYDSLIFKEKILHLVASLVS